MDNRAIGIFDSGFGGLTAVKALTNLMPDENIVFFGDNARAPYGSKTEEEIRELAKCDMDFVLSHNVKAVLVACGTVSSVSADLVKEYPLPVCDVLNPGVKAISKIEGSAPLGIIATPASIASGKFEKRLRELCPEREVFAIPCPEFVPLIEAGHTSKDDPQLKAAVESALEPLKQNKVSAILLGCTHYGIISEAITAYMGEDVELVSAAECAAREMCHIIKKLEISGGTGNRKFYTSGDAKSFEEAAELILEETLTAEQV